jgi:uncharacterized membrane protein HdeD (DUF308 family)
LNTVALDVEHVYPRWGWFLLLGILLILVGAAAFFLVPAATIGAVILLGWLVIVSGILETIHVFQIQRWSGVFLHLIGAVLGVLIGFLIVTHPLAGALSSTLLFAAFLCVTGLGLSLLQVCDSRIGGGRSLMASSLCSWKSYCGFNCRGQAFGSLDSGSGSLFFFAAGPTLWPRSLYAKCTLEFVNRTKTPLISE